MLCQGGTFPYGDLFNWDWFWSDLDEGREEGRTPVVQAHHPLMTRMVCGNQIGFVEEELALFDAQLDSRSSDFYFEYWFAGHLHDNAHTEQEYNGDLLAKNVLTAEAGTGWYRIVSVRGDKKDIHIAMDPNSNSKGFTFYPDGFPGSHTSNSLILKFGDGSAAGSRNFLINQSLIEIGMILVIYLTITIIILGQFNIVMRFGQFLRISLL